MNIEQLLAPDMMYALGWALIHSFWQGAVFAILLGLVFLVFRKSSSAFRYRLSLASLSLVFVFFVGTFITVYQANIEEAKETILVDNQNELIEIIRHTNLDKPIDNQSFMVVYSDYFNQHLPIIVTLWFLGMVIFALRFLGGLALAQRLRYSHYFSMNLEIEELLFDIQKRMDFMSKINLVESSLINVPMVIGYLKPMILMPIGLVNHLNIYEVEAILAHEMAHIKRYDYLVNIAQSIIETILFFHPAVWWISAEIRRERENCCDDLALEITDAITFAKALANVEYFRSNFIHKRKSQLSMAALNNKNELLNRVRRILNQPQKNQSSLKGLFAACILIISFIATSLDAQQTEKTLIETPEIDLITAETIKNSTENNDLRAFKSIENTGFLTNKTPDEFELGTASLPSLPTSLPVTSEVTYVFDNDFIFIKKEKEKLTGENMFFGFEPKSNHKSIARIMILNDTAITGAIKEVVIIREIIEKDGKTKEVKIKIKTKGDAKEIEVFEDERKLSENEQKIYQPWIDEIISADSEKQWTARKEREVALAQREAQVAIRKEETEVLRLTERENRAEVDKERRQIAEEKMRLAEEQVIIHKEIAKEQANVYKELMKIENEKIAVLRKEQAELAKKIAELQKTKQDAELKKMLTAFKEMDLEIRKIQLDTERRAIDIIQYGDTNLWISTFRNALVNDGLIGHDDKKFKLRMDKNGIKVNGKKLTVEQEKKYLKLYEELTNKTWSNEQTIEVNW